MKTNEIEASIERLGPNGQSYRDRGIWECALQLSIIVSKLPDSSGSDTELTWEEKERLESEFGELQKKYTDLTKMVKIAKRHIEKACSSHRPFEISGHLLEVKKCFDMEE